MTAKVIEDFRRLYYDRAPYTWGGGTYWMGVPVVQCPMDLWVYQELIAMVRPERIIETGSAAGGCALYFAALLDMLGAGEVISIDVGIPEIPRPTHPRVTFLQGNSTAPEVIRAVMCRAGKRVMVFLDSDHRKEHVAEEIRLYAPLVSIGSYLVVEDTNLNGRPVRPDFGPGPGEAVDEFLASPFGSCHFERASACERHMLTSNPGGYLLRVK